jgi:hypothetical protein
MGKINREREMGKERWRKRCGKSDMQKERWGKRDGKKKGGEREMGKVIWGTRDGEREMEKERRMGKEIWERETKKHSWGKRVGKRDMGKKKWCRKDVRETSGIGAATLQLLALLLFPSTCQLAHNTFQTQQSMFLICPSLTLFIHSFIHSYDKTGRVSMKHLEHAGVVFIRYTHLCVYPQRTHCCTQQTYRSLYWVLIPCITLNAKYLYHH